MNAANFSPISYRSRGYDPTKEYCHVAYLHKETVARAERIAIELNTDRFPDKARWAELFRNCNAIDNRATEMLTTHPGNGVSLLRSVEDEGFKVLSMRFRDALDPDSDSFGFGDNRINPIYIANKCAAQIAFGIYGAGYAIKRGQIDFVISNAIIQVCNRSFRNDVRLEIVAFDSAKPLLPVPCRMGQPDIDAAERVTYAS